MNALGAIIGVDFKEAWRDRRLPALTVVCLMVALAASWTGAERVAAYERDRIAAQSREHETWLSQGRANPHTVAHFGHYAFKSLTPLAAFDPGLSAYLGSQIWMEAHRQNPGGARAAEDALDSQRLADLTPAWILQVLAPLVIIALGFPLLARERESGLWRTVAAAGLSRTQLLAGKALSLVALSAAALAPAVIAAVLAIATSDEAVAADHATRTAALIGGYSLYLLAFVALTLAVSAWAGTTWQAVALLIGLWAVVTLMIPRLAVDAADAAMPVPAPQAFFAQVREDLDKGYDGHGGTSDDRAKALEARVLKQYGVTKVEELPISFAGIELQESELHGNQVFDRRFGELYDAYEKQRNFLRLSALASPVLSLREISARLAGTDEKHHRHFALAAEAHRRNIVALLNADMTKNGAGKDFDYLAEASLWPTIPKFEYAPPTLDQAQATPSMLDLLVLIGWAVAGLGLAWLGVRRWSSL